MPIQEWIFIHGGKEFLLFWHVLVRSMEFELCQILNILFSFVIFSFLVVEELFCLIAYVIARDWKLVTQ